MQKVTIYTDGACSGNPGPGGWGAILMYNEHKKELSGGEKDTTNNRMELMAAIKALECLKHDCEVQLYSDSAYLVNAFEKDWISNWRKNGWRTAAKEPVKNQDLWEKIYDFSNVHKIMWIKVKGHSDNEYNNRCDELAREAIKKLGE
jgi:ribonuclease HI